jgi:branched-chain amino acid transport system ATP-binding protein
MDETNILIVEDLHKCQVMPIAALDFQVAKGEILGIIGPNGAGKTTLFNLISGQVKPTKGKIVFQDRDITHFPAYKRCRLGIARTYQIPRPFLSLSVAENLLVGAVYGAGLRGKSSREDCETVLKKTGLFSKKDVLAEALPLLDRKRLELSKALATHPDLLLIDEVAGGLNESEVEEVLEIIHAIRREGITVMWVEHIMMAMQKGPDRLLVINFGEKLFCGPPREALESPKVQEVYLGAEDDDYAGY